MAKALNPISSVFNSLNELKLGKTALPTNMKFGAEVLGQTAATMGDLTPRGVHSGGQKSLFQTGNIQSVEYNKLSSLRTKAKDIDISSMGKPKFFGG